jgi:hypothetical protein
MMRTTGWRVAAVGLALLLMSKRAAAEVVLAEGGKSAYAIVVSDKAPPATRHAAGELRKFLQEISGAELPIVNAAAGGEKEILVGESARAAMPDVDWKTLGEEGYVIRTLNGRVAIAGGGGRGDLYGVYGLLSDHLGCRWFTPKISRIPKRDRIVLQEINEKKAPALEYREVMAFDAWDADWMVRNHVNTTKLLDDKHGGAIKYVPDYYVHTFAKLVPAKDYFGAHPEYFAEVKGKRLETGQLCGTNPEVAKIIADKVRALFKANPDCKVISISQDDGNNNFCTCPACAAVDEKEGSHAGQVLTLVNRVAEAVQREFPDRAVETLAYEWSRPAPKTMKARPNVIVRLSTIACSFGDPIETSRQAGNRRFRNDLEAWARACDRLWIWDYTTNFSYYLLPFPNQRVLDDNLRFFVKNHVTGAVEQGNWQSPGAGLSGLTSYLAATYLWNPNADEKKTTGEYLEGVYGDAAGPIGKWLDLLADEVEHKHLAMPIYGSRTPPYLTLEILQQSDKLWDDAEAAVSGNAELMKRVRAARLSHDYAYIEHWRWKPEGMVTYDGNPKKGKVTAIDPGYEKHVRRFLEVARENRITNIREGKGDWPEMEAWLKMLLREK